MESTPLRYNLARFAILYNYVGIFSDTDAELLEPKPLLELLEEILRLGRSGTER